MSRTERPHQPEIREQQNSLIPLEQVLQIINSTPGLLSHQKAQLTEAFSSIEDVEDQEDQIRTWRAIVALVADKLGIEIKPWPHYSLDVNLNKLIGSLEEEISMLQSFDLRTVVQGTIRALLNVSPNQLSAIELNRVVEELVKEGVQLNRYGEGGLWSVLPHNLRQNKT